MKVMLGRWWGHVRRQDWYCGVLVARRRGIISDPASSVDHDYEVFRCGSMDGNVLGVTKYAYLRASFWLLEKKNLLG